MLMTGKIAAAPAEREGARDVGIDENGVSVAPEQIAVRNQITLRLGAARAEGTFFSFSGFRSGEEHFAVRLGMLCKDAIPLVRVHSECITGDIFLSQRCDCGPQLQEAINQISATGGYVVYLRQEGRGIGLYAKLEAYVVQDQGYDTFEANRRLNLPEDQRDFSPAAQILRALGVLRLRLLTNNPKKVEQLRQHGLDIAEAIRTGVFVTDDNRPYLAAKKRLANHTLQLTSDNP